jgi:hypothetical protein
MVLKFSRFLAQVAAQMDSIELNTLKIKHGFFRHQLQVEMFLPKRETFISNI